MKNTSRSEAFTLIELLTVIAIISILAAIMFPVAGSVRETARASSCMTQMHQLWVATTMYKQDEGAYPPRLMNYVQAGVPANFALPGTMYGEQVRDINIYRCSDNLSNDKTVVVGVGFGPAPLQWNGPSWVGAPTIGPGLTLTGTNTTPEAFYLWDSYDFGPALNPDGSVMMQGGSVVYEKHYSPDWTGVQGLTDNPNQLKYANPPDDRTLLTYCTWHAATAHTNSIPVITMGGTAKKTTVDLILKFGPNLFNR